MEDHVEFYGDIEALMETIESGLEMEMYQKRFGHHLERDARLHMNAPAPVAPMLLEDLEPETVEDEPLC